MTKPKYQRVGPKISNEVVDWYKEHFPTLNAGVTWALHQFPELYRVALEEMRGYFSENELIVLQDIALRIDLISLGDISGRSLRFAVYGEVEDNPSLLEQFNVSGAAFLEKLHGLHRWQLACLELWAAGFNTQEAKKDPELWMKPLIKNDANEGGEV